MNNFESVTIVVGATDEEISLIRTIDLIFELCDRNDIDRVLPVYSKNASAGCLAAIGEMEKKYPDKVFGMEQIRPSIGGAIRDGFDTATSSHILLLPGDLAIDISAVPEMIKLAKENPGSVIKTSRWLEKNSFDGYPVVRKIFNRLAQTFLKVLFLTNLTDMTQPVQIMPTELYNSISFRELGFPFLIELAVVPVRLGIKVTEIPAVCRNRKEGKSKNSFGKTAAYLKTALRVRFSPKSRLTK